MCAIRARDESKLVDGADERANEEEIDERDEECVAFGAVVGKEGCNGPGRGEDGDDE